MAQQLRQVTDLPDSKTTFLCKISNVKVKFESTPPSKCHVGFAFDEGGSEISFATEPVKDCAQQIAFLFEKEWKASFKNPKALVNKVMAVEVHAVVDKKKRVLGAEKVDLVTLATGPTHFTFLLQSKEFDQKPPFVEFDLVMREQVRPEVVVEIKTLTPIDSIPAIVTETIAVSVDAFPKKYDPNLTEKEQGHIGNAKLKLPKTDKKTGHPPVAGTFEPLELTDMTLSELEDVWLRVRFESQSNKSAGHPSVPGDCLIPLKFVMALDPAKTVTFKTNVKKSAVNGIRYDVGVLEARVKVNNGIKFAQLLEGHHHSVNGTTGLRVPGAPATEIKHTVIPALPEAPAAFMKVDDAASPALGDIVFASIAGDFVPKKAEPKGNIGDPAPTASNITATKTATIAPAKTAVPGFASVNVRAGSSTQIGTPTAGSGSLRTAASPTSKSSTPMSTPTSVSTAAAPKVAASASAAKLVANCSLCDDPVSDVANALKIKDKTFCVPCAKKLVARKQELEQQKKAAEAAAATKKAAAPAEKKAHRTKEASASASSKTSSSTSSKSASTSSSSKPKSSSTSTSKPSSSSKATASSSLKPKEKPSTSRERSSPQTPKAAITKPSEDFDVEKLIAEAEKSIAPEEKKKKPSSAKSKPESKPAKAEPPTDAAVEDVLDFLNEGPPILPSTSQDSESSESSSEDEPVKTLEALRDPDEVVSEAIDFLKLEALVSPRVQPDPSHVEKKGDPLSDTLDFLDALSPRPSDAPSVVIDTGIVAHVSQDSASAEASASSDEESASVSEEDLSPARAVLELEELFQSDDSDDEPKPPKPTPVPVVTKVEIITASPVKSAPAVAPPAPLASNGPPPPPPPGLLSNGPPPPPGPSALKPSTKIKTESGKAKILTMDETKKQILIQIGNEVKDPAVQARIADVWVQYFLKKSDKPELLSHIVLNYYFLIGPLRLKPQSVEARVKQWEEQLFTTLGEKEATALRLKKVVEITRFETEEQIATEIKGILRRREEQKRKEAERQRQEAAASSFGGVMEQLNRKFQERSGTEETVDDAEIRALQELEAALGQ